MRNKVVLISLGLFAASAAHATTLDFEGLGFFQQLSTQYVPQGINFTSPNLNVLSIPFYNSVYYPPHSGTSVINPGLSDGIVTATLAAPADDFSVWYGATGGIQVSLFRNNHLVGSVTGGEVQFSNAFLSLSGIVYDSFQVVGTDPTYKNFYVLDDLSFHTASVQAVPEPASMAALGLGGLALVRRRRARKA